MPVATLRDRSLRFTLFREKSLTVNVPTEAGDVEQLTFLLRQPTVAQRSRIMAEVARNKGEVNPESISRMQATAVLLCALDPDTRLPVFEEADLDTLLALPAGGWLDQVAEAAMGLMATAEQAAKT